MPLGNGATVVTEFDDFDDEDWRATLAELRLLVASAGFAEWDAAMAASLEEGGEEGQTPRADVREYALSFARFLKVRSSSNLERMRDELGSLVQDREGRPVKGASMGGEEERREYDVLGGEPSDTLLEEVVAFANAVAGEGGYFIEGELDE